MPTPETAETTTTPVATPWYGAEAPSEVKGFVELKGWDSPDKAIKSYQELERFVGADKAGRGVIWPKDEADQAGWDALYTRLGRPETPDGYDFKFPDGQDGFAKAMAPILHKAGVPKGAASQLAEAFTAYTTAQTESAKTAFAERSAADLDALKTKWGAAYEQNVGMGRRAVQALGWDQQRLEMIEAAIGTAGLMEAMYQMGVNMGEDRFAEGGKPSGMVLTPDAAKARLAELATDKGFIEKLMAGDRAAMDEKNRLDLAVLGTS